MADIWTARGRVGTRLAKNVDNEGREIKFDIREDEEQSSKLAQTIELLVAAGYFRARIKGLSAFDKVVGGISWCISACDVELDIDLLYQENSSIGQKIALTEKIVRALPAMKCPHAIEPHQIQGLDMIHIFPVVQWLVKKAMENREERSEAMKAYAVSQFALRYSLPQDVQSNEKQRKLLDCQQQLRSKYGPQRLLRCSNPEQLKDELQRVRVTLLEYQRRSTLTAAGKGSGDLNATETDGLLDKMVQVDNEVSAQRVASLIDQASIREAASAFTERMVDVAPTSMRMVQQSPEDIEAQIAQMNQQLLELREIQQQLEHEHTITLQACNQTRAELSKIQQEQADIENLEGSTEPGTSEVVKTLLADQEAAKKREQAYKQKCREELGVLQDELNKLRHAHETGQSFMSEVTPQLKADYDRASSELQKSRLDLAKRNREIATLQRRIDDIPSQAELNQYQRRFLELYNQMASKHKETKQFYTLYNTLQDVRMYMDKEVNLLNSVADNCQQALQSEGAKMQFVRQLESIVENIKQTRNKVEIRQREENLRRDMLYQRLTDLQDKQRQYYKIVTEFQEECKRNEELQEKVKHDQ